MNRWPTKDPDELLDYDVDWTDWLGGDTIDSVDWTLDDGISLSTQSNTSFVAKAWISGGTSGTNYEVACKITTAGGRTAERTTLLPVRNL